MIKEDDRDGNGMPGDMFALVVAVGFLVSLLMIPLSLFVLMGTTPWFILSTLVFLVAGVLGARGEKGGVDLMVGCRCKPDLFVEE